MMHNVLSSRREEVEYKKTSLRAIKVSRIINIYQGYLVQRFNIIQFKQCNSQYRDIKQLLKTPSKLAGRCFV